jgi:hypothetical protein
MSDELPHAPDESLDGGKRLLLFDCITWVCAAFPASVTSWFRSPRHNRSVGGLPDSHHIGGFACDVVYEAARPDLIFLVNRCKAWGVGVVREKDHDHFQV